MPYVRSIEWCQCYAQVPISAPSFPKLPCSAYFRKLAYSLSIYKRYRKEKAITDLSIQCQFFFHKYDLWKLPCYGELILFKGKSVSPGGNISGFYNMVCIWRSSMILYKITFTRWIYNIFFQSTFKAYIKVLRGVVGFEGSLNIISLWSFWDIS